MARLSAIFTVLSLFPSLVAVTVTSLWSCIVFRKYHTGGDDQLNRRMLALPFIMPLTILASSVLEIALVMLAGWFLLSLSLGEYFPHWSVFAHMQNDSCFAEAPFQVNLPSVADLHPHFTLPNCQASLEEAEDQKPNPSIIIHFRM